MVLNLLCGDIMTKRVFMVIVSVLGLSACALDDPDEEAVDFDDSPALSANNYCVFDLDGVDGLRCFATDRDAALAAGDPDEIYAPSRMPSDATIIVYSVATFASGANLTGAHKLYLSSSRSDYCAVSHTSINYPDFRKQDFDNRLSSVRIYYRDADCYAAFWTGVNFTGTHWTYQTHGGTATYNVSSSLNNRASSGQAY
jgi:hypothetical protein